MSDLNWDDVLKRDDIVGGDIESQEDGLIFRCPISEIKLEGDRIIFVMDWVARISPAKGEMWKKYDDTTKILVNKDRVSPFDIGDNRVAWQVPLLGLFVIFPKGGSKLDPQKVAGLSVDNIT